MGQNHISKWGNYMYMHGFFLHILLETYKVLLTLVFGKKTLIFFKEKKAVNSHLLTNI